MRITGEFALPGDIQIVLEAPNFDALKSVFLRSVDDPLQAPAGTAKSGKGEIHEIRVWGFWECTIKNSYSFFKTKVESRRDSIFIACYGHIEFQPLRGSPFCPPTLHSALFTLHSIFLSSYRNPHGTFDSISYS